MTPVNCKTPVSLVDWFIVVTTVFLPGAAMLRHVSLPVALDGELEATLVTHERLHPAVRPHVLLQQRLPQIGLKWGGEIYMGVK